MSATSLIPRAHVYQLARELRQLAIEQRAALDGARRRAWQLFCHYNNWSNGCHPFWRCGFDHVFARLGNSNLDYTQIRGYDLIAASIGEEFSEWQGRSDDLWAWLAQPYERLPSTQQFLDQATAILARQQEVPF